MPKSATGCVVCGHARLSHPSGKGCKFCECPEYVKAVRFWQGNELKAEFRQSE